MSSSRCIIIRCFLTLLLRFLPPHALHTDSPDSSFLHCGVFVAPHSTHFRSSASFFLLFSSFRRAISHAASLSTLRSLRLRSSSSSFVVVAFIVLAKFKNEEAREAENGVVSDDRSFRPLDLNPSALRLSRDCYSLFLFLFSSSSYLRDSRAAQRRRTMKVFFSFF